MYTKLSKIVKKFDLMNQSIEAAKQYFFKWKEENPKEWNQYIAPVDYSDDFLVNISDLKFEAAVVRYEIRLFQENMEAISVLVNVNICDNMPIHYYCFFDMYGNLIDEFVDL